MIRRLAYHFVLVLHSKIYCLVAAMTGTCRIAGSETSSTAMTHTLMFLVRHPDLLTRLYKELALATASNPEGSLPTYDQIRNLPFLTACINESLRLRPVAANGMNLPVMVLCDLREEACRENMRDEYSKITYH